MASTTTTAVDEVLARLGAMTLEDKVDQLFIVAIGGTTAASSAAWNTEQFGVETPSEVAALGLGGVLYFATNLGEPTEIAELSNGIQAAATGAGHPGLFIALDQEGGRVRRLPEPFTLFPRARTFGRINRPDLTERAAAVTATEMRAVGINQVLAPVLDVSTDHSTRIIGDRSYGTDPEVVADMGAAAVSGFTSGGVLATAKHFPGHGPTAVDSHQALPVIDTSYPDWYHSDRIPFRAAAAAGAPAMIVGHLALPALDPAVVPASLSEPVVQGILRRGLGFRGLVMTDALQMEGARSAGSDGEIAVMAIEAGADLLLMPRDFHVARQALLDAVASGRIPVSRIDESVERILRAKHRLGVLDPVLVDLEAIDGIVGAPEHRAVLDAVSEADG